MDKTEIIKWNILHYLNNIRKKEGPHGRILLNELAKIFFIDYEAEMFPAAYDLHQLGHIKMIDSGPNVKITEKGIRLLDPDNPFIAEHCCEGKNAININAPVSGSTIAQGHNISIGNTLSFLDKFVESVSAADLPEEERKTWMNRIRELSLHPVLLEVLKKVLGET